MIVAVKSAAIGCKIPHINISKKTILNNLKNFELSFNKNKIFKKNRSI